MPEQAKYIVIVGTARKQSDTERLVHWAMQGIPHRLIHLLDVRIAKYNYEHQYPPDDQFLELMREILQYEHIIFATPVYWYTMSTELKIFFDRLTDLLKAQKPLGRQLRGKKMGFLSVGADVRMPHGFDVPFYRSAEYLGMHYLGGYYSSDECIGQGGRVDFLST